MIPQVVAAALVSENKVLCHPASVDSIPTSADKEDHVSMGPISARKARQICEHVAHILAIEGCAATQGLELLSPLKPSKALTEISLEIRKLCPFMGQDRSLSQEFQRVANWVVKGGLDLVCDRQQLRLD
jgi:histidine ammonia-lyase